VSTTSHIDIDAPTGTRLIRRRLASDLHAADVLRAARDDNHPVALSGRWFGGRAVVASEPVIVSEGPSRDDPFELLDAVAEIGPPGSVGDGVYGGWIGNLGYRCGQLVERLPDGPERLVPTPDWWLGYYDHVLHQDAEGRWWFEALWTSERAEALDRRRAVLASRLASPGARHRSFACGHFAMQPSAPAHQDAVRAAIEHIEAGDIYQANVCLRLDASLTGSALDLFSCGIEQLDPPYAAFVDQGSARAVASLSPERFLRRVGPEVSTRPIKGTRRRSDDESDDRAASEDLAASEKDRAENVMIVDLMRNDLGRVCVPGSIEVPHLFELEAHPGVWHLVSEVRGRLAPGNGDGALLRASFPPGSVTGAPKVRAMEIIADIEASGREAYTGVIGMVSPVAGADWNVAIRTFEVAADRIWLGVGGGIVADSDPAAELEECRTKAQPLLDAIGATLDVTSC
jgi:para-aminobenzoate synthetase / 4-amino-4-deoxychorismate lyase